ncbi:B1 protein [Stomoxys calcitrans]|uniref:B1 protein n=1 Tax=Stomoxys calcitrans TaxID=35570 RepID=UPI0027E2CEBE|nr:B1 protein [Stomoxys calcitrans]
MNRLLVVFLILFLSKTFAERPDWYPENAAEIEADCKKENGITPEIWSQMLSLDLEDTPAVRSVLLCLVKRKTVYRPENGFEAERLQVGLQQVAKRKCDLNHIKDCGEKFCDLEPEDFKIFSIFKCTLDDRHEKCEKVE